MLEKQAISRTLRVAAIQVESQPGCIEANHAHAAPFIEQAARDGAQLIILPELFACGYIPNQSIWDMAEPKNGLTVRWLRETSKKMGIYLGAGLIETDGADFFNTFVITAPDGEIAGRAQKANAEAYCFRRGQGYHIINTAIGKIGIGICADNHFISFLKQMQDNSIDIMLMPHAWPTPYRTSRVVSREDLEKASEELKMFAQIYAGSLGVPAVFVNPVGPIGQMAGFFGKLMVPSLFRLQGMSRIVDSDGTLKGELGNEEGILMSDITLDPLRKKFTEPRNYGGWLHPGSVLVRKLIFPVEITYATLWYKLNRQRKKKALRAKNK